MDAESRFLLLVRNIGLCRGEPINDAVRVIDEGAGANTGGGDCGRVNDDDIAGVLLDADKNGLAYMFC